MGACFQFDREMPDSLNSESTRLLSSSENLATTSEKAAHGQFETFVGVASNDRSLTKESLEIHRWIVAML